MNVKKLVRVLIFIICFFLVYETVARIKNSSRKLDREDLENETPPGKSLGQEEAPTGKNSGFKTIYDCNIQKDDIDYTRARILETNLAVEPYPHLIIEDIFTSNVYGCILKCLKLMRSQKILKKTSSKMSAKEIETAQRSYNDLNLISHLNRLEEIYGIGKKAKSFLKDFSLILNDAGVQQAWLHRFSGPLSSRQPKFEKNSRIYSRQLLTIDGSSYAILPHTDTVDKLVTILIYLPKVENLQNQHLGTLLLQKSNTSLNVKVFGKQRANWEDFIVVKQAPFKPNLALAFSACDESWHAVHEVGKMKEPRISLQTFLMKEWETKLKRKDKVGPCSI